MKTYNELARLGQNEALRMEFICESILLHESSVLFRFAQAADDYYKHRNPTIMNAQKMVYDMLGRAVPDIYAANNKIPSRYYFYFVTQEVQHLLGNGVTFANEDTKERLGRGFDRQIQLAATKAINAGVSFGFWNFDHLEVFGVSKGGTNGTEAAFIPLYDEENGALRAGIRYWQIDSSKPLRVTLYEEDGITEYIRRKNDKMTVLREKKPYITITRTSAATGTEIFAGENYPSFPIVPMWNICRQSELVGNKETIDAYDLMASALINNIDDANLIYWVLKNCNGMDDIDDAKFIERLKTTHIAHADGDDGSSVEAHTIDAPYEANDAALERLRSQLFDDFMALDVKSIANGAATATQIRAAYEPLTAKVDMFEYEVTEFIERILALAGIDDVPTYTRSVIVNKAEEVQSLVQAGTNLPQEYVTKKIVTLFGDGDQANEIVEQVIKDDMDRFSAEE